MTVETDSTADIASAADSETRVRNFALLGTAGFIAPKHLQAIRDTGNRLLAAADPHDSVGVLDRYFPDCRSFTAIERFDRFLEKQRRQPDTTPVEYVSVCTPNYLHDAHVRLALRVKAHAICEKPLVINPWNLEQLAELEEEHERRVFTVLQLRLHPAVQELRRKLAAETNGKRRDICLTYITRRGAWYHTSWKGQPEKSGGVAMNIGVHLFDLLLWLFGSMRRSLVHCSTASRMSGCLELDNARVRWFLSVDGQDLPAAVKQANGFAWRSITIDGEELDLSPGFSELHTEIYREVLAGRGFGIKDVAPTIELVHNVRNSRETTPNGLAHPILGGVMTRV